MKRFTDTLKWQNAWFRSLQTKHKILFIYILDSCDNAGVMHLDFELINFVLKENFSLEEFTQIFSSKVIFLSHDKIIIKNFIRYQQGSNKNSSTMAKHIEKLIENHGIQRVIIENGLWEGYR